MTSAIIDLHMHSFYSDDGEYSPEELVKIAASRNIKHIALTDHNSTKGVKEAMLAGINHGVNVIPGIELDCIYEGSNLHVLGYHINPEYYEFAILENSILKQEQVFSLKRLTLIEELGIYVNHEKLARLTKNGIIIGEMIAEAAIHEPENKNNPLIAPYLNGERKNPYVSFHWEFCAPGKPAHIPIEYINLATAVKIINAAGGIAILAHPGKNVFENEQLLAQILAQGVKGIEVYSSYHSPEQLEFYQNKANEHQCLVTCGSDFHGKTKPEIQLGQSQCPIEIQIEIQNIQINQ